MRGRIIVAIVFMITILAGCGKNTADQDSSMTQNDVSSQENDKGGQWDDITKVTIYSDGYFERSMDNPLTITDEKTIQKLIDAICKDDEIIEVPSDERYEGINGVFVDFGNGVVVSMYDDMNYGNIGSEMIEHGEDVWLPKDFYDIVVSFLKNN
ncbi:MAG: hypothetical protein IJP92_06010 [Lachnospiraceae bacterium]|nr:hypothetical protein [Lachnospiraceae bacterium]